MATRYWVGSKDGRWDRQSGNWSDTEGGAPTAKPPGRRDTAVIPTDHEIELVGGVAAKTILKEM